MRGHFYDSHGYHSIEITTPEEEERIRHYDKVKETRLMTLVIVGACVGWIASGATGNGWLILVGPIVGAILGELLQGISDTAAVNTGAYVVVSLIIGGIIGYIIVQHTAAAVIGAIVFAVAAYLFDLAIYLFDTFAENHPIKHKLILAGIVVVTFVISSIIWP